jgi:hypothetical protein
MSSAGGIRGERAPALQEALQREIVNLRKYARGQNCQVRLPDICNHNPETVVLAHFRLMNVSGAGLKSPDLIAAWCCSACHTYVDSHKDDETQLVFAHGVMRTIAALVEDSLVHW